MKLKFVLLSVLFVAYFPLTTMAQRTTVVRGVVSDELGAVIVGATVSLIGGQATTLTTITDEFGAFRFNGIAPGNYSLTVAQPGFATFQQANVAITDGQSRTINVTLRIAAVEGQVTVDPGATVNTDPTANKSAVVLKGNDLNALSDDPTELAAELSALAGPAAGPSGASRGARTAPPGGRRRPVRPSRSSAARSGRSPGRRTTRPARASRARRRRPAGTCLRTPRPGALAGPSRLRPSRFRRHRSGR